MGFVAIECANGHGARIKVTEQGLRAMLYRAHHHQGFATMPPRSDRSRETETAAKVGPAKTAARPTATISETRLNSRDSRAPAIRLHEYEVFRAAFNVAVPLHPLFRKRGPALREHRVPTLLL
jgi:hypothetical protein